MMRRCSHPTCRTSLDEYPVQCPHGLPFCGDCVLEDGCDQCATDAANLQRLADIWADADHGPRPTWTPGQEDAERWAEQRAEERRLPHIDPREDDRGADDYYSKRWGA